MSGKKLRESDLSAPVVAWLRAQGYEVYTEVFYYGRIVDIIGRRDRDIIGIELKLCLTVKGRRSNRWPFHWRMSVIEQALVMRLATDQVYVAVASRPRESGQAACAKQGLGLLRVHEGKVEVLLRPTPLEKQPNPRVLHRRLNRLQPGGIAGQPNKKGGGPAQAVERLIKKYKKQHPRATWRELFENIPNHYKNRKSMMGAILRLRERSARVPWGKRRSKRGRSRAGAAH